MKKRFVALLLCILMVACLLPSNVFAYVGALKEQSPDDVRTGTEEVEGVKMLCLENDYIFFSVDKATGLTSYTLPTRLKDISQLERTPRGIMFYVQYPDQSEKQMYVDGCTVTQGESTISFSYTFTNDYYKKENDANLTYEVTYSLVKLGSGKTSNDITGGLIGYDENDSGTTWGVYAKGTFKYEGLGIDDFRKDGVNTMTDNYRGVVANCVTYYEAFPAMGHPSQIFKAPEAAIFLSKAVHSNSDLMDHHSFTNISSGLGLTSTNVGGTYLTEVYTDSYSWANPFVATSLFYQDNVSWGVEGYTNWPNLPAYVSYNTRGSVMTKSEAYGLDYAYNGKMNASSLWGYRDLRTPQEELDPTTADAVKISEQADRLAVFAEKDGGYTVKPAKSEKKLDELKSIYGTPVAVFRGAFTTSNGVSYIFTDGAVALSPTVIATWGPSGEFTVSNDGKITHSGVSLNAPTFKFYQPSAKAKDEELTFEFTEDALKIGMIPENNSATVYVDIPYATVGISSATVSSNGDLVFEGNMRIGTVFDGAEFELEKLGYGLNGSNFKVNGVQAKGEFSTADLFNMDLLDIKGEINTFKGQEKYHFELELNAFDLFETAAELELKRCQSNGVLMPNDLYFYLKAGAGIPIVPPVVIGQLTGGGAGFYGLADTVNGDFLAIPPIALRGTVTGTYLHLVEGTGDFVVGPGRLELEGKDIHIVGTPAGSDILKEYGYKFYLSGQIVNYGGKEYTGLSFGGSKYFQLVLPSNTIDIFKIDSSISAGAFGGLDNPENPKEIYLKVNANGKLYGTIQVPSNIKTIGGKKLASIGLDAILVGQTVIPVANTTAEEAAKKAFTNMDIYLGIAATVDVIGSDFRAWVILPDVAKPKKNVNWGFDYKIAGKLDDWDWEDIGLQNLSLENNRSYGALNNVPMLKKMPLQLMKAVQPTDITLASIGTDEQAYIALAFPESVTEDEIKAALTIRNTSTSTDFTPVWLETDSDGVITNRETANITSDIMHNNENGNDYRLVIVHVGGSEVSGNTFKVNAGSLAFTYETATTEPFEKLDVSIDDDSLSGSVKYPASGAKYVLRTYFANEKGGADYLIDERVITDTNDISVDIPSAGILAPSGNYYISTFLSEERTGDWDDDPETPDATAQIQIDSASSESTVNYTNVNQPESLEGVAISAVGNEVMQATWKKVEGADSYKITVYKYEDGKYVDSGYGYKLDTSDPKNLPSGLSYNSESGYSFNMALTVGGTAEDGSGTLLAAGENYKIGVTACKTVEKAEYYSVEALSNEELLPEYTPLDMTISLNYGELYPDSQTGIYTGYVKGNAELILSAENASFIVKLMDGTVITPSYGSYSVPDFEGTIMLEVTGSVANGNFVDKTTRYVLIYKDNIAPIITLDKPVFYADDESGSYTVSGITEPGASVDYGAVDEYWKPITVKAGDDGKFTINGSLKQADGDILEYKTLFITSADSMENTSTQVLALVNLQAPEYTLTVNTNGGSGNITGGDYKENTVITIDAGTKSDYTFKNWTSSDGGTFADANSASTTFTMPDNDVTVTANWTYTGSSEKVYNITQGAGGTWTKGTSQNYSLISDASLDKFTGAQIDGNEIDGSNYEKSEESAGVTLKAEYLETLSTGTHTFRIILTDGYAESTFTVESNPGTEVPPTGDYSVLWAALVFLSIVGLAASVLTVRKRIKG